MRNLMTRCAGLIGDLIFPSCCVSCGRFVTFSENHLCPSCRGLLKPAENSCSICGGFVRTGEPCVLCSSRKFYPERNITLFEYDRLLKGLLHGLKFGGLKDIHRNFIPGLAAAFMEFSPEPDWVTFVPMNRRKEAERGYNQSMLLAEGLAGMLSVPCRAFLQERGGYEKQRELGKTARYINVIDRYRAVNINLLKDRTVVLVDDVFTTGATINECARQLLDKGAFKVFTLTVARANPENIENI